MMTPTTAELHTAIEVLNKLNQRIKEHAIRSVRQMPGCGQAGHLIGQINVNLMEQTQRSDAVAEQLQNWRNEILNQQKQNVSQTV